MMNDEQLSPIGESSVPVPNRMLRRLKKAKSISDLCPGSEVLDSEKSDGEDLGKSELQSAKGFDGFEKEDGVRSDLEGLGVEDGVTARKVIDFDSVPEFNQTLEDLREKGEEDGISDSEAREEVREAGKERPISVPEFDSPIEELGENGEDGICDLDTEEEIRVSETKEAGKKRQIMETSDGEGKERKRDKKRNKKSDDFDELPVSTASMNMTKKERREYLDQLRAENQRLLRETRDAAFEPAPLVRKPISSVLEKIRRRKEEISKQFLSRKKSKSIDICDEDDFEEVVAEEKNEESTSKQSHGGQHCSEDSAGPLENSDSPSYKKADSSPTHQDPSLRPQTINSGDELLEKTSSRSLEEVMTPSVVAMNLKLNLSPVPDKSSEEAKENFDLDTHDSSPGDPVRKFIDEDAEEEDDSDNDLLRFEDEDDDEDEEDDDLRDMIVSQFKEDPTDKDRRNELHQKWLEQQDAAGTEKLLQKLKHGLQHDETLLSEDEDEDDDADDEERAEDADDEEVQKPEANEDDDEDEEDPSHANSMRMTIKKIKEMIPLMFTDEDDVYVSSDDEEMEKKLLQQRLFKKMELKAKSSSSTGDENSEEILRHIKKPEIKKKAKPSSFKERALMEINKNPAASKSSFLGRLTKSSMSEGSRKRGSNVVRGYIFERDDSNSKSSNTVPEEPSPPATIIKEKSRPKRAPAKFTASQSQERSATLQATAVEETSTRQRTTLYEILKMSSKLTCFNSRETMISSNHTESIFAAFKLDKKPVKTNPQEKR
ncbi:hypothetical protein ISN45_Aa02g023340 [Arabidopsis thaliana x Arabidopsis arenosa]|uniref:DNA ligase-like protein n=1 Tax=Arabidopsis thaliana x Arabidopsis arenosa TaxID=1240361 RepID=A0A8T2BNK7_9BRAS|nr:hypothetical protein ISN45_Aa02g023340 [Arabidopsis thaliana x Arabidopsis arenosa]